jgi:hypothetical protein
MESDDLSLLSSTTRYHSEIKNRSSHPSHYSRYDPQPIEVIESWDLGFHLGNVVKYIVRAKHKGDEMRDLRAALWYLKRYIQVVEAGEGKPPKPDTQV